MMTNPFGKQFNNSSSNYFSNIDTFIVPLSVCGASKFLHIAPQQAQFEHALAANADIDALAAFTARILAIHLRLNAGFIDRNLLF